MLCPVCKNVNLTMAERSGIEIDYCPNCRGVWLDRGELDKIIERAGPQAGAPAAYQQPQAMPPQQPMPHQPHQPNVPYGGGAPYQGGYYKKKKREGFLGELFDFD